MGLDEQLEEREMLMAIFPEEITEVDNDPEGRQSFDVLIVLDPPPEDESGQIPQLILRVTYPTEYPEVEPVLHVSLAPDSPKNPYLFSQDFSEDGPHLLSALQSTVQENFGTAMIYSVILSLKESAENLIQERIQAKQNEKAKEIEKAEEEENRKFKGTAVTKETFLAWRDKFVKDQKEEEERKKAEEAELDRRRRGGAAKEDGGILGKLTGKQLWERGLVGKAGEEEDDEDGGEDALADVEKLKISA